MSKAKQGDLIRIIPCESNQYIGMFYEVGDILEVKKRDDYEGVIAIIPDDSEGVYVYDYEYVIHRKAGEEDSDEVSAWDAYDTKYDATDEQIRMAIEAGEQDVVNHPNHYTQGKFETIEVIEEITSGYTDGYVAYCVGNALKYEARAPFKHDTPLEDLRKAAKYLAFAIDYLDAKSTQD